MARFAKISPILLDDGEKNHKGLMLRGNAFNIALPIPVHWRRIGPVKKLLLLFSEVVGLEQVLEHVEGFRGRKGEMVLKTIMDVKRGEFLRVLLPFGSGREEVVEYLNENQIEWKHGPAYYIERAHYPYLKALLISVDSYYNVREGYLQHILEKIKREIIKEEAKKEIRKRLGVSF